MKKSAKKILCIGEALIDVICSDRGKSLAEGQHFLKKPGGAPTNVAAAIAALGGSVELLAKVGADPFGRQLIGVMEDFGVSTRSMVVDNGHFTTFAFVSLMEDGERDFVFNRGADGQLTVQEVEAVDLSAVGIVHFGSATGFLPGPLLRAGDHTVNVPSIPVKPVDTTGAGDAFVGAVLYQLSEGYPAGDELSAGDDLAWWERIVANANKAGARTCEYMGAMEAFRHLSSQIFE